MIDRIETGKNLKEARQMKGLTVKAVARKVFVTPQAVYKWESGRLPSIDIFLELADCYGMSVDELVCRG